MRVHVASWLKLGGKSRLSEFDAVITEHLVWDYRSGHFESMSVESADATVFFFYRVKERELYRVETGRRGVEKTEVHKNLTLEQAERIVLEDEHIKTRGLKIKKEDIKILEEVFICE